MSQKWIEEIKFNCGMPRYSLQLNHVAWIGTAHGREYGRWKCIFRGSENPDSAYVSEG